MRWSPSRGMMYLWLLFCVALTGWGVYLATETAREEQRRVLALDDLERLVKAGQHYFGDGSPPVGEGFWKAIGKSEAMLDPWGHPYKLEKLRDRVYLWRCAGKDGQLRTADDLTKISVFREPHLGDAPLEKENPSEAPVGDAK